MAAGAPLERLVALRTVFGAAAARSKLRLLAELAASSPAGGDAQILLHETLLFLRAYPDSAPVRDAAEAGLRGFSGHVERLRLAKSEDFEALDEKGLAGTSIYASFSLPIAVWLAQRFPGAADLYRESDEIEERLGEVLHELVLPAEAEALYDRYIEVQAWFKKTAPRPGRTPLARLLAVLDALALPPERASALWSALALPLRWDLADGVGSRTLARAPRGPVAFQTRPRDRSRVDLAVPAGEDLPVRQASGVEARRWIDLARAATAARMREVHTYNFASPRDITIAACGDGLTVALYGVAPEARHALRVFYGYLLVRNEVPIGYGDALMLFDWGELNFHVFDTFRQAGSAQIYGEVVRLFRQRFGLGYLFLNRYQFGHHNPDAIASGAFWFYEKLGFRPRAGKLQALGRAERRKIERDPAHRSSATTLRRLASDHMGIALDGDTATARAYRGFHPMYLGLAVTRRIESAFGGDRRAAAGSALRRVRRVLGGRFTGLEAKALERMAPVLDLLPDLETWSREDLGGLAALVRRKAGRSERVHLLATAGHTRLKAELVRVGSG